MRNPFIVFRIAVFALSSYMNLYLFAMSIWNLASLKSIDSKTSGPGVLIFLSSIFYCCCQLLALSEYKWPSMAIFASVKFEVAWTMGISGFQLLSGLILVIAGPPAFCKSFNTSSCASMLALIPVIWISTLMLLAYSMILLFSAISHVTVLPDVWSFPVNRVPWFNSKELRPLNLPQTLNRPTSLQVTVTPAVASTSASQTVLDTDVEKGTGFLKVPSFIPQPGFFKSKPRAPTRSAHDEEDPESPSNYSSNTPIPNTPLSMRPTWAKDRDVRRGVDHPFGGKFFNLNPFRVFNATPSVPTPPPPTPPPKSEPPSQAGSTRVSYAHFPEQVANPDLPIDAKMRVKEWVRAGPRGVDGEDFIFHVGNERDSQLVVS
ncbi:hypothetical protein C8Q75DRAFT_15939 [Abortiporus biennis]|nr:hypothetical protein C8Q75DRAFT_15939 [Abortiporus biennis]